MSRKRPRTSGGVVRAARRPIAKSLIMIVKEGIAAAQVSTQLFVTTFPATMVGLRWSLSCIQSVGTAGTQMQWAIVISRDGDTPNTMSTGDGNDMYSPESNVLAFGCCVAKQWDGTSASAPVNFNADTKTMRKLKTGDRLDILFISEAANTWSVHGAVQFFVKT